MDAPVFCGGGLAGGGLAKSGLAACRRHHYGRRFAIVRSMSLGE
jgi:hypothetical protein